MLKNYLTMALRSIKRHPGNAAINVLGLSLGMASFILIMLFVQDQLSYDQFHDNAERIYRINKRVAHAGVDPEHSAITAGPVGPTLEFDFPEVEESVRVLPWFSPVPLGTGDVTLKIDDVLFADASFLDVFSFRLLEGDAATALQAPQSIVLSVDLASRLFGDSNPMGETLVGLNDHSYKVTGIVENSPHNSHLRYQALISWSSTIPGEGALQFEWMNRWMTNSMYTFILLRDQSNPEAFAAKLPGFLLRNYAKGAEIYSLYPQALSEIHLGSTHLRNQRGVDIMDGAFIYIFGMSAFLILLIACINFVNMSTALADDRSREVGVRKALGANRLQLKKQFLGESILIAVVAFLVAVAVVEVVLPRLGSLMGKQLDAGLLGNLAVLGMVLIGAILVGLFAGLYPALVLSRFEPATALRGGGKMYGGGIRLRQVLVIGQFGISTILVVGSVVVYQQTTFMQGRDLGIDQDQVVVIRLANTAIGEQFDAFKAEMSDHPGVVTSTASWWVPGNSESTYTIKPEGRPEDEDWIVQILQVADFDFAKTYGLDVAAGRFFDANFPTDSAQGIVINKAMARSLGWETDAAIGKRIDVPGEVDEGYVIGVMKDFHLRSLQHAIDPVVFISQNQPRNLSVRISPDDVAATLTHMRQTWDEFETRYPFEYSFVDETFGAMYAKEQQLGSVLSVFSLLAAFVACLGLFGLAALTARRRTKEIGIRKTLGASVADILGLLTGGLARLLVAATVIAVPIAYIMASRWLEGFAYRIDLGVGPFAVVAVSMIAIGLAAVAYQSIRAALADPVKSLRYE